MARPLEGPYLSLAVASPGAYLLAVGVKSRVGVLSVGPCLGPASQLVLGRALTFVGVVSPCVYLLPAVPGVGVLHPTVGDRCHGRGNYHRGVISMIPAGLNRGILSAELALRVFLLTVGVAFVSADAWPFLLVGGMLLGVFAQRTCQD